MGKRPTAQEVAEAAGVSKWTVIRAFTPGAPIAEASRKRVLEVAERLNYSPNLLARSLATNLTHQVAVFVDDFLNPHKLPFLAKLTEVFQAEGMVVMLININRRFDHIHALINADQRKVDAVILFGTAFRDETLKDARLGPGAPPMFVLARDSQIDGVPAVTCDAEKAMEEVCGYLFAKGYRRPGFMAGPKTLSTALGRRAAFGHFWGSRGVAVAADLSTDAYSIEAGAAAARTYLASASPEERPDVLCCENDVLAFGAIDVAKAEFGLAVPGGLAVAGFDDVEFSSTPNYDLTTYAQPVDEMVRIVADMALGRRERTTVSLTGRFVPRGSA